MRLSIVFGLAALPLLGGGAPEVLNFNFSQINYTPPGPAHSAWANITIPITLSPDQTWYLNANQINGTGWFLANLPIPSAAQTGATSLTFNTFAPLFQNGTNAAGSTFNFVYTVTLDPFASAPAEGTNLSITIGSTTLVSNNGILNPITVTPPTLVAGTVAPPADNTTYFHPHISNFLQPETTNQGLPGAAATNFLWFGAANNFNLNLTQAQVLSALSNDMGGGSAGFTEMSALTGIVNFGTMQMLPAQYSYWGGGGTTSGALSSSVPGITISQTFVPNMGPITFDSIRTALGNGTALTGILVGPSFTGGITIAGATQVQGANGVGNNWLYFTSDYYQDGGAGSTEDYNSVFALPFQNATSPTGSPILGWGNLITMIGISPMLNPTPTILTSGLFSNNPGMPTGNGCNTLAPDVSAFGSNAFLSGTFFANGIGYIESSNFFQDASYPFLPSELGTGYVLIGSTQQDGIGAVEENSGAPGKPESFNLGLTLGSGSNTCTLNSTLVQTQSQATDPQTGAAHDGEPISALTGEVTQEPPPDLSLGGPAQLQFQRYYGSLLSLSHISSALGGNWMSNFDVQAYVNPPSASVSTFRGNLIHFAAGTGNIWTLAGNYALDYQFRTIAGGYQFMDPSTNLIYTFNSQGNLTAIADRNGNTLTVTPGTSGPTMVSDGLGRTLTLTYTGSELTGVQDQTGRSVSYSYNNASLAAFTDANGKTTDYTYTTGGTLTSLLSTTVQPAGNTLSSQTFDSSGRAITQSDGNGNTSNLVYSANIPGQTMFSDPAGNTWTQSHPNLLDYTSSVDPYDHYTTTDYDANGRPISVVDRNGNTSMATYDSNSGYLASRTDAENETTTYSYSRTQFSGFNFSDLSAIQFADGTSATFTRDALGNVLTRTDATGKATKHTYNAHGQPLTITNPLGGVTTLTYNADGTLSTSTSPAGSTTTYAYDALKRPSKITFADGSNQTFTFDPLDRLTSATNELGKTTTYTYTSNSRLASLKDPLNNVTTYTYDADDNQTTVASPDGTWTTSYNAVSLPGSIQQTTGETASYTYDKLNRVAGVRDTVGQLAAYTYDNEDNLTSFADGAKRLTQFGLDRLGRVLATITPLSEIWANSYNQLGKLASQSDPLGNTTTYAYDPDGRLSGVTLPGSISATYAYDGLGDPISITNPNGNVWANAFDSTGRETSATDPLGQSVTRTYDSRNRMTGISNSAGTGTFTYDAASDLTGISYTDGTQINYVYDANGRIAGATNATFTLDPNGEIVNSNGIAMTRDSSERVIQIMYPPGPVTYSYNSRGQLAQMTDWTGANTTFSYDASLRLLGISRANGVTTTDTYDGDGRLASITETLSGSPIISIALTRDADGNILTSARNQPQYPSPGAGVSSNTFNAADEMTSSTYDTLGRLTKDPVRTYTWDLASRMQSYTGLDGSATFAYDGFGTRISRTSQGVTQNFVNLYGLTLPVVAIARNGNADQRYYIYLPDGTLLYAIDAGGSVHHYYHFDESGNTIALTSNSGTITDSFGITPFGESVVQNGSTPTVYTWQGQFGVMQEPGTTVFYARARYYDSAPARFLSRDPQIGAAPLRIDRYTYALDNPTGLNDPSGLNPSNPGMYAAPSNFGVTTSDAIGWGLLVLDKAVDAENKIEVIEKAIDATSHTLQNFPIINSLESQAQNLKTFSNGLTAVGTALQIEAVVEAGDQLKQDLDQAQTNYDTATSQANSTYNLRLKHLKHQLDAGEISLDKYHELQKEALAEANAATADAGTTQVLDQGIAVVNYIEDALATYTPIPTSWIHATSKGIAGTPK